MIDISKIITPEKYYLKIAKIDVVNETDAEWNCRCIFHNDSHKSFSINKTTGLWKCFGSCGAGNILQYHAKMLCMSEEDALTDLKIIQGLQKVVPPEEVEKHHQRLLKNKEVLSFLKNKRGLMTDTLRRFKIGFTGARVSIPIKVGNYYLNMRLYRWQGTGPAQDKMLSYTDKNGDAGYGEARLFPYENLKSDIIYLFEGELDCILGCQMGYPGVTTTAGAGTWTSKFTQAVAGKTIYIVYDIDPPGRTGAEKVIKAVLHLSKEVRNVNIPLIEPKNADFSNLIIDNGYSKASFDEIVSKTDVVQPLVDAPEVIDDTTYRVPLNEASSQAYFMKQVEMRVIVAGKDLAPYFVPQMVHITCGMGQRKCAGCGLGPNAWQGNRVMEIKNPTDMLQLIEVTEAAQKTFIRTKAKIMPCTSVDIKIEKVYNIEQVRVIPEIDYQVRNTEYVAREIFVQGHGIKTNTSYLMRGVTVPDPKTQYATQVVQYKEPLQLSIDHFKMTPEVTAELKIFQPGAKTIKEKLAEIHTDLTINVTQIYERVDIQRIIDLVYHSVLNFRFNGRRVTKGWVEGLVIGDTRCGKSETIEKMIMHYKAGELVTGENTSYAGLIGGMQQTQQRWSISWGKIPLNDRRLVAIDEASGLHVDQISLMSGVRSSGVAEIVKIQTEKTHARTRLIWSSNPRSGRRLDTYNHGVVAIKELIGRVEDVARFDIATTAASGEVSLNVMAKMKDMKVEHKFTSELCNKLILWAWSRTIDQVNILKETQDEIYKSVNILDDKYSSAIPLMEPAEQRIKLARMATSLAVRLFSTEDGETVIVRPEHVREIVDFLQEVFDKPSMGYDMFSEHTKRTDKVPEGDLEDIKKELRLFQNWSLVRDILLQMSSFKKNELIDQLGYDGEQARALFAWLGKHCLIKSLGFGYVKQVAFTALLKDMLDEKEEAVKSKF